MKNKKKPMKIVQVFIMSLLLTELFVIIAVLGLYYSLSAFKSSYDIIYVSTTPATIVLITVVSIITATKVSKNIFKPFRNIQHAAKNIIHGDFSVRLPEDSGILEIDEVACDFNIMVKELGNTEMLKEDFIANVSHEFKTPLSVIEGYATLLQGDINQAEKDEYINMILQNTEKLNTLTGNILILSKLENRSIPLEKEKFRLDMQICNIMVDFETFWEAKKMDIDLQLEPVEFYGFRTLLAGVWSNLIQNAIKFSDTGGSLTITCNQLGSHVVIVISDQGIGMREETKIHMFDKFYQGEVSRSTQGNGLGLALVKQTIILSNGTISVESEPGAGSKFTINLPNKL